MGKGWFFAVSVLFGYDYVRLFEFVSFGFPRRKVMFEGVNRFLLKRIITNPLFEILVIVAVSFGFYIY